MRTRFIVETLFAQMLLAISVSQAWAGCLNPPISAQSIVQFKSDPQALVAPNSDTRTVEALTRDLAGTDASLAAELVRLAEGAKPRFQTAIAAGLAQAALACSNVDQKAALLIQQAVAGFQDGQFQAAFAAVAGDLSTAATAAATAFATGSAGSVVITNPNSSLASPVTPGGGGAVNSLVLLTTAAITLTTTNNTLNNSPTNSPTTVADSVSPTR
jgi:hypothetical protein